MTYAYARKKSTMYLRSGTKIEVSFWKMAALGLDRIDKQTDDEIRQALKLGYFPDLYDKHLSIEREDSHIIAYTTGSNLVDSIYNGCIIRWFRT